MKSRCFIDYTWQILSAYGYRLLFPDMTVMDFNPLDIARHLQRAARTKPPMVPSSPTKGPKWRHFRKESKSRAVEPEDVELSGSAGRIIRRPTTIPRGSMFTEDVVTMLPYRETRLAWDGAPPVFAYAGEVCVVCTHHVSRFSFFSPTNVLTSQKCRALSPGTTNTIRWVHPAVATEVGLGLIFILLWIAWPALRFTSYTFIPRVHIYRQRLSCCDEYGLPLPIQVRHRSVLIAMGRVKLGTISVHLLFVASSYRCPRRTLEISLYMP